MSLLTAPWPIESQLPSELAFLANHISSYFSANPPYNNATLGALIFTPPPQPPSLLVVQVCQTLDPHTFSCAWEVPSGSPKSSDVTLLHTLARIVFEQTGLHLSRVLAMSGSETGPGTFESGNAKWIKHLFTVQVSELDSDHDTFQLDPAVSYHSQDDSHINPTMGKARDASSVSILLDQEKHQKHAWVTESDLQEFVNSGLFPRDETKQYLLMLDAFTLYRQETMLVANSQLPGPSPNQVQSSSNPDSTTTLASTYFPSETTKRSLKVEKRPPKKKGIKADKEHPNPSHFNKFRIS